MLPRGRLGVFRLSTARISVILLMTLLAVVSFMIAGAKSARADWNDDYPYSGGSIDAKDPWGFYTRECTSFVAFRLINRNGDTGFHGPIGNGAQNWGTVYASITNHNPAPGSVAWWSSGHVAWVESVSGSNVTIEEYNWNYNHNFNERTISASNPTGFIHFKDIPASSPHPPTPYDPRLRAAPHLSADFTGDGKPDVAVLYDYGNNDTALLVFRNTGSGFAAPTVWWDSGPGNWIWANSKPVVGDFNADGKPDIAVAYDYGNSDLGLLVLANTGKSFSAAQSWYRSGPGGVNLWAAKMIAADFNGDGKTDIGALYDYGNNDTALLVFRNTGSAFGNPVSWWNSGVGNWSWGQSTPLVGDFNGDGKPDVMVMYDYGNNDVGLLLLPNTGSSFGSVVSWYRSGPGGANTGAAWPIVGDFNGDGKTDVLMMYDYGSNWTKFLLLPNTGSGFASFSAIWDSGIGNWSWGWSVPLTADFNSDGKPDVVVMYNYGNNDTGLNLLPNTGTALGSPATSWYRSGPGSFNWGAATAM